LQPQRIEDIIEPDQKVTKTLYRLGANAPANLLDLVDRNGAVLRG
jgi:hypothetical protein